MFNFSNYNDMKDTNITFLNNYYTCIDLKLFLKIREK